MKAKRLFDIIITSMSLLVCLPGLVMIALMIRCFLGSPVLFQQRRLGRHGKPFLIYKFRTMLDQRDAQGELLLDDQRLTAIGHWLRSTSLDELPQLWNVLKGEMSLVGPRPLLLEELPTCPEVQAKRHTMPPGITGLTAVMHSL